ncbi:hypothetical protein CC78DRAFT_356142 [Lojkania enalia]|uniref:Cyclochlorotine biosynthesis protein O n=1 Tax=Lojkania enalia TaxID=147567 RepID=A0A9P4K4Y2_9PLEO|nr:hypothetical protein CC78DRAFT_356142 [Didymosphaeria enalia]
MQENFESFKGLKSPRLRNKNRSIHVLWLTNVVLVTLLFWSLLQKRDSDPTLALFSPANHVVRYRTVVFDSFRNERTPYMPPEEGGVPNDDTDMAWEDLYKAGISRVPKSDATKLVNWTVPIPGDQDHYIVMLDVFHQLHCLNIIRRALYPERYHMQMWDGHHLRPIDNEHLEHCVDSIRQLITCHSDISTHYWRWEDWHKHPGSRVYSQTTHTCRNFEKIQEWAIEHRLRDFDFFTKASNEIHPENGVRVGETVY